MSGRDRMPPSGAARASLRATDDAGLEAALRDLGAALAVPHPTVDPARAARLRLEAQQGASGQAAWARWFATWRAAWPLRWSGGRVGRAVPRSVGLALAALLLLAGLAVAVGLGLPGIRFIFVGATPSPSSSPILPTPPAVPGTTDQLIASLHLGVPVDVSSLDAAAGFHVRIPRAEGLATPAAAVRVLRGDVRQASLVYLPTADYPSLRCNPAAIIVTAFPARLDDAYMAKLIDGGIRVETVTVNGHAGYWISGSHEIAYLDDAGRLDFDSTRLVGPVLAWNDGLITYRIEGAADLATALALAESLR